MTSYPLVLRAGLMVLEHDGLWLIDTGAPTSFSPRPHITLAGQQFNLADSLLGYTAEKISELLGFEIAGLLGTDVVHGLDWIFDLPAGKATISDEPLAVSGNAVDLHCTLGVPVIPATVRGRSCRVIFDTGAELSYFPPEFLSGLSSNGQFRDFNPAIGWFDTDVYSLEAEIASYPVTLRASRVSEDLGLMSMAFRMTDAEGLVGIQLCREFRIHYAPRRGILQVLTPASGPASG
ncbi:MAG: hypothetical protein RMK57_16805 [Bryobacterales bacterium]|nr:hypothetical protein [Bryobacteraceae bacterium]MDW8356181.1 hypothetical protein [Bryobacterales bacterium]